MEYGEGGGFAQDELLPNRNVARDNFKYMTWSLRDYLQGSQFDSRRAPGDTAKKAITPGGTWTEGTVHERTLKDDMPDEILANAPNAAQYESAIVKKLMNSLRLEVEIELQALMNNTTLITDATPSVKWDAASGTIAIEKNIDAAREAFVKQCGFAPTHIILPPTVADVVKRDSSIRSLRIYTEPGLILDGGLPSKLFGLNVVSPGCIEDSANPAQSASIARVWSDDNAVLCYVDPSASTDPTAMTAVMRFSSAASTGTPYAAYNWRDPDPSKKTTWYRVETFDEIKAVADCMYIISDVLT
jgi:hypothetical protein